MKQGVGGIQKSSTRRMRKSADIKEVEEMSELRPTGLELGSQRGSHYIRTADSSLSLG